MDLMSRCEDAFDQLQTYFKESVPITCVLMPSRTMAKMRYELWFERVLRIILHAAAIIHLGLCITDFYTWHVAWCGHSSSHMHLIGIGATRMAADAGTPSSAHT